MHNVQFLLISAYFPVLAYFCIHPYSCLFQHTTMFLLFVSAYLHVCVYLRLLSVLEPFPTIKEPRVHRPIVGSALTLQCHPTFSYPPGVIYWGENNQSSKLQPIENTNRVSLDYNGNNDFIIRLTDWFMCPNWTCAL